MDKQYSNEKNIQILIRLMKEHNVKKVIISPGATNVSLVGSLQHDPFFELYSSVDERSAAYMACGLAAESGEAVALSCTGATASRNYVSGLTEAFYRHLPILAITSTQHMGRIGHNIPQVIDRRKIFNDIAKMSIQVPTIYSDEDCWAATIQMNSALIALRSHGGGPVHINLVTTYDNNFSISHLPEVQVVKLISARDAFPSLPNGKIAIFVGNHAVWDKKVIEAVDLFCERYNAIVIGDHTSNYKGNYWFNAHLSSKQEQFIPLYQDIDLLIHLGDVSGAYLPISPKVVWRVHEDGVICDTFKKLEFVFEMTEIEFFSRCNVLYKNRIYQESFYLMCQKERKMLISKIPELPFSNTWIAQYTVSHLPKRCVLHLAILNTLRNWNFFDISQDISVYSNTGGFGIDGDVSALVGASLANPDKLFFGIIGDLAFFYDMNVLGNRHISNNLRILLINNGVGTEFKNYNHRAAQFGSEGDAFMAAAGHFGKKSRYLVKHYAEDLGFEYFCANNKSEYIAQVDCFMDDKISNKPKLFEVFTNSKDESDALYLIYHLMVDIKKMKRRNKIKKFVKFVLGEKNIVKIKKIIKHN